MLKFQLKLQIEASELLNKEITRYATRSEV